MALPPNLVDREQGKFRDTGIPGLTKLGIQIEGSDVSLGSFYNGVLALNSASTITTPGVQQTLISYSVPATKTHALHRVVVSCRQDGKAVLEVNSVIVGVMRTSPSKIDSFFVWTPPQVVATGILIELKFTSRSGSAASDLDAFIMADEY